jgi:putative sensory transduction regulator
MSDLRPFSVEMFEQYARARDYRYLVEGGRNYLIRFRAGEDVPAVDCWLYGDGAAEVVTIRFYTRERFEADESFAVSTCDAWNRTRRWPTAYSLVNDVALEIVLEGHLIVDHGVTDEWLADFLDAHVRGAFWFWEELDVARRLKAA